jgi:cobalt/nickel transport system permease protein
MESKIPSFLLKDEPEDMFLYGSGKKRFPFLDRTISNSAKSLKIMYLQAESAGRNSHLCNLNPVTKVISFIYLIVIISFVSSVLSQFLISCFIFILYLFSSISIIKVYKKVFLLAFLFGFLVSAPAAFNVITPGETLINIITFAKPHDFWIYYIPSEIGITIQGCKIVTLLFLRVFNSISLALLLAYSTSFPRMLKAFRIFFIPNTLLMVVSLAYKFIFILCRTIEETYLALKSRLIRNIESQTVRRIVAGRIFFIYEKAHLNYEQTYSAMISRGYEGKIILVGENKLIAKDFLILLCVVVLGAGFIFI